MIATVDSFLIVRGAVVSWTASPLARSLYAMIVRIGRRRFLRPPFSPADFIRRGGRAARPVLPFLFKSLIQSQF